MAVIWILSAIAVPIAPPMAAPIRINSKLAPPGWASVVPMAIAMPTMPARLPRLAELGDDSPRSAMMKQTAASR